MERGSLPPAPVLAGSHFALLILWWEMRIPPFPHYLSTLLTVQGQDTPSHGPLLSLSLIPLLFTPATVIPLVHHNTLFII